MRIVQINMVDFGSTGRIMLQIAGTARSHGAEVETFSTRQQSKRYYRMPKPAEGHHYYGSFLGNNLHYLLARVTGKYGCYSRFSTWKLIRQIKAFKPDLIHLHNLHAAFLNLPMLFRFIKKNDLPVVWTLHDCWAFTGKCPHFAYEKCEKWKTGCDACPRMKAYPQSLLDSSKTMWRKKKKWYEGLNKLTVVTPSQWLSELVKHSLLKNADVRVIHNGIDLSVFQPADSDFRKRYGCENKFVILGVAFGWNDKKGLDVFLELAKRLGGEYRIVLVGTDERIDAQLPENVISIHRTQNQQELAQIYTAADLFVNPTREEALGLVNLEALACGTPVVTFKTGGSPECIDESCGAVVACDDIGNLHRQIIRICKDKPYSQYACQQRALLFDMHRRYEDYYQLFKAYLDD